MLFHCFLLAINWYRELLFFGCSFFVYKFSILLFISWIYWLCWLLWLCSVQLKFIKQFLFSKFNSIFCAGVFSVFYQKSTEPMALSQSLIHVIVINQLQLLLKLPFFVVSLYLVTIQNYLLNFASFQSLLISSEGDFSLFVRASLRSREKSNWIRKRN